MSIAVTPLTKLKKPLALILMGEQVNLFHHEKGSSHCVIEFADGESRVAALCDLDLVGKKFGSSISSKPKTATPEQKQVACDLNSFFDSLADKIPFHCNNCGTPLYAYSKKAKRSVCAHIFPKATFESIKTNPDNILFMGADYIGCPCSCHDRWDMNIDIRKKLIVAYDIAVERFEILKPFMTPKEINKAYEYLGMEVKV